MILAFAEPQSVAELRRLREITFQLQALQKTDEGLGAYVRKRLLKESQSLLSKWPEGHAHHSELAAQQSKNSPTSGAQLALQAERAEARRNNEQSAEAFQREYKEAASKAREGVVLLQQLALEVFRQRDQACKERFGFAYHEGYKKAILSFRDRENDFISERWVLERQRRADLTANELGSCAVDPSELQQGQKTSCTTRPR